MLKPLIINKERDWINEGIKVKAVEINHNTITNETPDYFVIATIKGGEFRGDSFPKHLNNKIIDGDVPYINNFEEGKVYTLNIFDEEAEIEEGFVDFLKCYVYPYFCKMEVDNKEYDPFPNMEPFPRNEAGIKRYRWATYVKSCIDRLDAKIELNKKTEYMIKRRERYFKKRKRGE